MKFMSFVLGKMGAAFLSAIPLRQPTKKKAVPAADASHSGRDIGKKKERSKWFVYIVFFLFVLNIKPST